MGERAGGAGPPGPPEPGLGPWPLAAGKTADRGFAGSDRSPTARANGLSHPKTITMNAQPPTIYKRCAQMGSQISPLKETSNEGNDTRLTQFSGHRRFSHRDSLRTAPEIRPGRHGRGRQPGLARTGRADRGLADQAHTPDRHRACRRHG
ncbi:UNVERIFIED_CONTAM: hypothetical protein NO986_05480 [Comamonas sp. A-3]